MKLKPFGCSSDLVIVDWLMTAMWKKNHYPSKNKNESKIKEEKIDKVSNIVKNKQIKNSSKKRSLGQKEEIMWNHIIEGKNIISENEQGSHM